MTVKSEDAEQRSKIRISLAIRLLWPRASSLWTEESLERTECIMLPDRSEAVESFEQGNDPDKDKRDPGKVRFELFMRTGLSVIDRDTT